jgi:hypothetical protein
MFSFTTPWTKVHLEKLIVNWSRNYCLLWIGEVHYHFHRSPPLDPPVVILHNMLNFKGKELLTACPTPNLEGHHLSAVCNCLFITKKGKESNG